MKILLIGATGYIGNVVAERLMENGHQIVGTSRNPESASKLSRQGIDPITANFQNPESLLTSLKTVDAVVYAAYAYNSAGVAEQEIESGISHITPLLDALKNSKKKFILTSGTGVVPDSTNLIYTEETPLPPSKSAVTTARRNLEMEVIQAANDGIHSIVLRPPCVYGRGGSFIVPRFLLDHALAKKESVYVKGTENNKRSAVHIEDLADLFVLALQNAKPGSLYCTGAESNISTIAIAESISRCAQLGGTTKSISLDEAKAIFGHWGEWWSLNNQCSGEKARKELGWHPTRSSLLEEIEKGSYAKN